ncbi:hypothetical protein D187_005487 [Cystobacter fuscus DSM 2262]|uniref:Uncharacterized protein n=1 Tax=Cystobacter fuscus (strain ATCC 25194 / DSM 2262 / NBRC 100088 / M29) TaxID=1242864 RepID=S9R5U5_CYSF2|nr:hypothetical protein D187_005487 [Cystobacter fuscus DSM 2262]
MFARQWSKERARGGNERLQGLGGPRAEGASDFRAQDVEGAPGPAKALTASEEPPGT